MDPLAGAALPIVPGRIYRTELQSTVMLAFTSPMAFEQKWLTGQISLAA